MKKAKKRYHTTIYVRYILPFIAHITTAILAFFPFVRFTLGSDVRQKMSLLTLIRNIWKEARLYLFSANTEKVAEGVLFYRTVFVVLILLSLLYLISLATTVFTVWSAIVHFKSNDRDTALKTKNLYLTFIPNRIVMLFLYLFALPILFMPQILVSLYRNILMYAVSVTSTAMLVPIVYIVLFLLPAIFTVISKKYEMRANVNIFSKAKNSPQQEQNDESSEREKERNEQKVYHMTDRSAEEQRQRLRELLGYEDKDESNE